jgi:hypothetical protein
MKEKTELEPCPLPKCKGEAIYKEEVSVVKEGRLDTIVKCKRCGLSLRLSNGKKEVIRRWNER